MRGFTVVEVMVVIAIVAIVSCCALVVSMEHYRGHSFGSNRDVLIVALEHARAQAMNGVCLGDMCTGSIPHGVFIDVRDGSNALVAFQGASYAARDVDEDTTETMDPGLNFTGVSEIVFAPLSGDAVGGAVTFHDAFGHSATVTIGDEGQISSN